VLQSIVVAALVGSMALAAEDAKPAKGAGDSAVQDVTVGIFVNQINAVNLHDNLFTVDCNLWFRWKGDGPDPLESFEIINGKVDLREKDLRSKVNGENYATCRVVATITRFWNISAFPLDNHRLSVAIEDQLEDHRFRFVADTENSGMSPEVQVPGWVIGRPLIAVAPHTYNTNYGDTSLPTGHASRYSRFTYSIPVKRPGYGYCLKLFLGLLVATALGFSMFFVQPTDDPRFNLGVGAIFAVVASEYIVASCLPATHVLTLADALHMLAMVFIFLSIAESVVALKLCRRGRELAAVRLDRCSFVVLGTTFVGICIALVAHFCQQLPAIASSSGP
jgi:hypothetical protein